MPILGTSMKFHEVNFLIPFSSYDVSILQDIDLFMLCFAKLGSNPKASCACIIIKISKVETSTKSVFL